MSFWHLRHHYSFLYFRGTTTSFRHVASLCWLQMTSNHDMLHGFGLQGEMDLGFEFNQMDLFTCKAKINYSSQMNMDFIQILCEFESIEFMCLQMSLTSRLVNLPACRSLAKELEVVMIVFSIFWDMSTCSLDEFENESLCPHEYVFIFSRLLYV